MDINEITALLGTTFYTTNPVNVTKAVQSTTEDETAGTSAVNTDNYVSTILNSMDAIPSGTYTITGAQANVYGDTIVITDSNDMAGSTETTGEETQGVQSSGGSGGGEKDEDTTTQEIVTGPDGSLYLKTTTKTEGGEMVTMTKLSGGFKKPDQDINELLDFIKNEEQGNAETTNNEQNTAADSVSEVSESI